jgi:hypothetical protein
VVALLADGQPSVRQVVVASQADQPGAAVAAAAVQPVLQAPQASQAAPRLAHGPVLAPLVSQERVLALEAA